MKEWIKRECDVWDKLCSCNAVVSCLDDNVDDSFITLEEDVDAFVDSLVTGNDTHRGGRGPVVRGLHETLVDREGIYMAEDEAYELEEAVVQSCAVLYLSLTHTNTCMPLAVV